MEMQSCVILCGFVISGDVFHITRGTLTWSRGAFTVQCPIAFTAHTLVPIFTPCVTLAQTVADISADSGHYCRCTYCS